MGGRQPFLAGAPYAVILSEAKDLSAGQSRGIRNGRCFALLSMTSRSGVPETLDAPRNEGVRRVTALGRAIPGRDRI
jgi:hypothetical protein